MANPPVLNRKFAFRTRAAVAAVASCFALEGVALPVAPTVVNGSASFAQSGKTLTVTNSNGAVIDWQKFSIGAGETTRFIQPSASSAVMNRVLASDPSLIYGTLTSNGRVWLVNPAGILVGPTGRVDVAGLVATTLNVSLNDFLAQRLNFQAQAGAGSVVNQGALTTPTGGSVYLVAPNVTNEGLITTPKGETILAAGQTVELVDTSTPGVRVAITGSEGNATNLGQIVADAGRVGIAGVLVKNSGTLNASSAVEEGGRIFLRASRDAYVDKAGRIVTTGTKGGRVEVLGERVAVADQAAIDASGRDGGGRILVGGDVQGKNPAVQNAQVTFFGPEASLRADAEKVGAGGTVVVWADDTTRAHGSISAKGGAEDGNGGFVETSGKRWLDVAGVRVGTSAAKGNTGTWLLDPTDISIYGGSSPISGGSITFGEMTWEFTPGADTASIYDADINANLNSVSGTGITISSNSIYGGTGNIFVYGGVNIANTSDSAKELVLFAPTAASVTLQYGATISGNSSSPLNVLLQGGTINVGGTIAGYGGTIYLNALAPTTGAVSLGATSVLSTTYSASAQWMGGIDLKGDNLFIDPASTLNAGAAWIHIAPQSNVPVSLGTGTANQGLVVGDALLVKLNSSGAGLNVGHSGTNIIVQGNLGSSGAPLAGSLQLQGPSLALGYGGAAAIYGSSPKFLSILADGFTAYAGSSISGFSSADISPFGNGGLTLYGGSCSGVTGLCLESSFIPSLNVPSIQLYARGTGYGMAIYGSADFSGKQLTLNTDRTSNSTITQFTGSSLKTAVLNVFSGGAVTLDQPGNLITGTVTVDTCKVNGANCDNPNSASVTLGSYDPALPLNIGSIRTYGGNVEIYSSTGGVVVSSMIDTKSTGDIQIDTTGGLGGPISVGGTGLAGRDIYLNTDGGNVQINQPGGLNLEEIVTTSSYKSSGSVNITVANGDIRVSYGGAPGIDTSSIGYGGGNVTLTTSSSGNIEIYPYQFQNAGILAGGSGAGGYGGGTITLNAANGILITGNALSGQGDGITQLTTNYGGGIDITARNGNIAIGGGDAPGSYLDGSFVNLTAYAGGQIDLSQAGVINLAGNSQFQADQMALDGGTVNIGVGATLTVTPRSQPDIAIGGGSKAFSIGYSPNALVLDGNDLLAFNGYGGIKLLTNGSIDSYGFFAVGSTFQPAIGQVTLDGAQINSNGNVPVYGGAISVPGGSLSVLGSNSVAFPYSATSYGSLYVSSGGSLDSSPGSVLTSTTAGVVLSAYGAVALGGQVTGGGGQVSVSSSQGSLTQGSGAAFSSATGMISLMSYGSMSLGALVYGGGSSADLTVMGDNGMLSIAPTGLVQGSSINLKADRMDLSGPVTSYGAGTYINVRPWTSTRLVGLGTTDVDAASGSGGKLALTTAEIGQLGFYGGSGSVRIHDGSVISLDGSFSLTPNVSSLWFDTGGRVVQTSGGVTAPDILFNWAYGGVDMMGPNDVSSVHFMAGNSGQFKFASVAPSLTVYGNIVANPAQIPGGSAFAANQPAIHISNQYGASPYGDLVMHGNALTTTGSGGIRLEAGGSIHVNYGGTLGGLYSAVGNIDIIAQYGATIGNLFYGGVTQNGVNLASSAGSINVVGNGSLGGSISAANVAFTFDGDLDIAGQVTAPQSVEINVYGGSATLPYGGGFNGIAGLGYLTQSYGGIGIVAPVIKLTAARGIGAYGAAITTSASQIIANAYGGGIWLNNTQYGGAGSLLLTASAPSVTYGGSVYVTNSTGIQLSGTNQAATTGLYALNAYGGGIDGTLTSIAGMGVLLKASGSIDAPNLATSYLSAVSSGGYVRAWNGAGSGSLTLVKDTWTGNANAISAGAAILPGEETVQVGASNGELYITAPVTGAASGGVLLRGNRIVFGGSPPMGFAAPTVTAGQYLELHADAIARDATYGSGAALSATAGGLHVEPVTAGRPITLYASAAPACAGGNTCLAIDLADWKTRITGFTLLGIGQDAFFNPTGVTPGTLTLAAPLDSTTLPTGIGSIFLGTGGSIVGNGNPVGVSNLYVSAADANLAGNVDTLVAKLTGPGGLNFSNAKAMTVGSLTDPASGASVSGIQSAGPVTISTAGTLTNNGGIFATNAPVTLTTTTGNIINNPTGVFSYGGSITMTAAGTISTALVDAGAGTVKLTAYGGGLVDLDGAAPNVVAGALVLDLNGDSDFGVQVGKLAGTTHGRNLKLANAGALALDRLDLGAGNLDLTLYGGALTVAAGAPAGANILGGSVKLGAASIDLNTQVAALDATAAGNIVIREVDGLALAANSTGGDVNVTSATGNLMLGLVNAGGKAFLTATAGSILDGNDPTTGAALLNIKATEATLVAANGIGILNNPDPLLASNPLETEVAKLSASTTSPSIPGDIAIFNTGPVNVALLTAYGGGSAAFYNVGGITTSGAVKGYSVGLKAASPITIGTPGIQATNNIVLVAGATAASVDHITLYGGLTAGGSISLTAADNIVQNAAIAAGTTVNLAATGGTITSNSTIYGGGNISLAAYGGIAQNSNISSGAGSFSATSSYGSIVMSKTAVTTAPGGVDLAAAGDITLGFVDGGSSPVTVTTSGGSIGSADPSLTNNIKAGNLTLDASTGIKVAFSAAAASVNSTTGFITVTDANTGSVISNDPALQPPPETVPPTTTEKVVENAVNTVTNTLQEIVSNDETLTSTTPANQVAKKDDDQESTQREKGGGLKKKKGDDKEDKEGSGEQTKSTTANKSEKGSGKAKFSICGPGA